MRASVAASSLPLLIVLVVGLATVSLAVGVIDLPLTAIFTDPEARDLLMASRLPRTLAAMLAGAGLAIAGLVMQTLARNRFVEPATAGTAQSAAFGILLVTIAAPAAPLAAKVAAASVAALAGTSLFLALAHRLPPTQPYLVALFGIVYGGVIGAAATFIAWQTDLMQLLDAWLTGEFSGVLRGRYEILFIAGAMVALAWWAADRLTVLSLGREAATSLGLDYGTTLRLGLVIVAVISALAVVTVGIIPFVGLVVPNLASRLVGDNLRATIPWVALGGAALVLACDIVGRVIRMPYEIPVATVLGVVGALVFVLILIARGRHV